MSVQVLNTGGYRDKDSRIQHADAWTTKTNGDQHRRKEGHANSLERLQHVSPSIEHRWILKMIDSFRSSIQPILGPPLGLFPSILPSNSSFNTTHPPLH